MIVYPEIPNETEPIIFDSHAHFYDEKFEDFRDELLENLPKKGVKGVINCGCDRISSCQSIKLAEKYSYMFAAVGIHPENIDSGTTLAEIEELSKHKKCVAIGEGCVILPGVTIGDRAVIGAGSVVTRDIPADTIAVGNPCRVVRHI